jgi:hypothetical protein
MHSIPPSPLQVASHAERLSKDKPASKLGLLFSGITAVSLSLMTTKLMLDTAIDVKTRILGSGKGRE